MITPELVVIRSTRPVWPLVLVLCASLAHVGCDDDEEGGGGGDTSGDALGDAMEVSPSDAPGDTPDSTDATDTTPPGDTLDATTAPETTDTTGTGGSLRYLRIVDTGAPGDTIDAGADIDAIVVFRGEQVFYASTVEAFQHGGGLATELDPADVLGPPDAFSDWQGFDPVCSLEVGYASLGGDGGLVVVELAQSLQPGDEVYVLEVGGCTGNEGAPGIPDPFEVSISDSAQLTGDWQLLGSGEGPVATLVVP